MVKCSLCGVVGSNKRSCPLTGGGKTKSKNKTCMHCGSDWLYMAPSGRDMLCKECYDEMHEEVVAYHKLQDAAENLVKDGNIKSAILLLKDVIKMRNASTRFFNDHINSGHDYYANEFLPKLIVALQSSKDPVQTWQHLFKDLEDNQH